MGIVVDALRAWSDGMSMPDPVAGLVLPRLVPLGNVGAGIIAPRAGKARRMYCRVNTAPGVGQSWTFQFFKNGAPTALAVTITGAATQSADLVNEVTVAQGDRLEVVPGSSVAPAADTACRVEVELV